MCMPIQIDMPIKIDGSEFEALILLLQIYESFVCLCFQVILLLDMGGNTDNGIFMYSYLSIGAAR